MPFNSTIYLDPSARDLRDLSLKRANSRSQCGMISKLTNGAFNSQIFDKNIEQNWSLEFFPCEWWLVTSQMLAPNIRCWYNYMFNEKLFVKLFLIHAAQYLCSSVQSYALHWLLRKSFSVDFLICTFLQGLALAKSMMERHHLAHVPLKIVWKSFSYHALFPLLFQKLLYPDGG